MVVRDAAFAQGCAEEWIEQIGFSTAADASDDFDEPVSLARDELFQIMLTYDFFHEELLQAIH